MRHDRHGNVRPESMVGPPLNTRRINTGLYSLQVNGNTYQVERRTDGSWVTFRLEGDRRQYMQDYATKRAAVEDLALNA